MADISSHIRTDYKAVDKRDEIRNVMGWLRGDTGKMPVIVDDEKPFGLVSDRALLGRRVDPRAKVEGYTLNTRALTPQATLEDAMARMAEFRAAYIPVEDAKGKLAGYVSALDIVREQGGANGRTARELCVPITVMRENQTLNEVSHVFGKEYVDYLPVVDAKGRVSGVLPRRTLVQMEAGQIQQMGRKDAGGERIHPLQGTIDGYVDNTAPTVPANASFDTVLQKIEDFGCAIVQGEDGTVVGIATAETLVQQLGRR